MNEPGGVVVLQCTHLMPYAHFSVMIIVVYTLVLYLACTNILYIQRIGIGNAQRIHDLPEH